MTGSPLLSIIIPLYNTEKYIGQCLQSIVTDSNAGNYEIIVVDDGSSDASADIVKELQASYRQIRYVRQSNQGVSMARANGASLSAGEYLWFVDSDDYLTEHAVSRIMGLIESDRQLDLIAIPLLVQFEDGHNYVTPTYPVITKDFITSGKELLIRGFRIICPQQFIIRKDVFSKEGVYFPQGIRYEDEYFSRVVQYYANHVQVLKDYLYIYRQWPGSFMNSANCESAKYLVAVYKHLAAFAESHVSDTDRKWFTHNIVSFLLETHTRFPDQLDSAEFKLFRQQYLPFIRQEFYSNLSSFPIKERFLGRMLLRNPRRYFRVVSRFRTIKQWLRH